MHFPVHLAAFVLAVLVGSVSAQCSITECPAQPDLVCGSNEQTYTNECFLKLDACANKTTITVATRGSCPRPSCDRVCSQERDPLCGPDGAIYGNKCLLEVAHCKNPTIDMAKVGECTAWMLAKCKTPSCPDESTPVCGSDGTTYRNACELANAACDAPGLSQANEGACVVALTDSATNLRSATAPASTSSTVKAIATTMVQACVVAMAWLL